jgi:hypothetical protein
VKEGGEEKDATDGLKWKTKENGKYLQMLSGSEKTFKSSETGSDFT